MHQKFYIYQNLKDPGMFFVSVFTAGDEKDLLKNNLLLRLGVHKFIGSISAGQTFPLQGQSL